LETRMREAFPEVTRVFIEAQSRVAHARQAQADAADSSGDDSTSPGGDS